MKLTEEQYQAVHNRGGHLLVSAAAGSGKTKVLIDRLMTQLTDPISPADIREFLIITFTQAAAAELRSKIEKRMQELLTENPEHRRLATQLELLPLAQISTIHAFCSSLIRDYNTYLKLPRDFVIASETELKRIREEVFQEVINNYQPLDEKLYSVFCNYATGGKGYGRLFSEIEALEQVCIGRPDRETWLDSLSAAAVSEGEDYASTLKGAVLFQECKSILRDFKEALQHFVSEIDKSADPSGKYAAVLYENIAELDSFLNCCTWDELSSKGNLKLTSLYRGKTQLDPDWKESVKNLRSWFKKRLDSALGPIAVRSSDCFREETDSVAYLAFLLDIYRDFSNRFHEEKLRLHLFDFNDLEHETLRLLYGNNYPIPNATARRISRRYREIMIDEYQDTSLTQEAILQALTGSQATANLFAVGDIKQSIYRFRLAEPGIFLKKYNTWKPASQAQPPEPRKICLNRNFRSDSEILDAVNDICSRSMSPDVGGLYYTDSEALVSGTGNGSAFSDPVELHIIEGETEDEANLIAQRILTLLSENRETSESEQCLQPGDIAILLRSPKNVAELFANALSRVGIPAFSDTGSDIFKTEELTFLVSMLEIIDNPRRDIPLTYVLSGRFFRFSLNSLLSFRNSTDAALFDAVLRQQESTKGCFVRLLEQLSSTAYRDGISAMLEELLAETLAIPIFRKMPGGNRRVKNIDTLRSIVYTHESSGGNLTSLLELLRCYQKWGKNEADSTPPNAVRITSIHKSKGLEYPVVILPCLSKGFNNEDLKNKFLFHGTLGAACDVIDSERGVVYPGAAKKALAKTIGRESLSEEMRILYVALTRAKNKLIFSYCDKKAGASIASLSRLGSCCGLHAARYATCPGDWVLLEAVQRNEAAFLSGLPEAIHDSKSGCWKIFRYTAQEICTLPSNRGLSVIASSQQDSSVDMKTLADSLNYRYPFEQATALPARITATAFGHGLEASAVDSKKRQNRHGTATRKFNFSGAASLSATEIGTALHTAMQFVRFSACTDEAGVREELRRLVEEEYLTPEQAAVVPAEAISAFFHSDIGIRTLSANKVVREFHFSILANSGAYFPGTDEPLLVQGIADCCIFEGNSFSIIDFKTDRVPSDKVGDYAARYRTQLDTYARALSTVFELPCKDKLLYFMSSGTFVKIS